MRTNRWIWKSSDGQAARRKGLEPKLLNRYGGPFHIQNFYALQKDYESIYSMIMQAEERLSFVEAFQGSIDVAPNTDDPNTLKLHPFYDICQKVATKYGQDAETLQLADVTDEQKMLAEIICRIEESDGSYLHIVLFWENQDVSFLSINSTLVVNQHSPDGVFVRGHTYKVEEGTVIRNDSIASVGDEKTEHFSKIATKINIAEFQALATSEWDADRAEYQRVMDLVDDLVKYTKIEKEMGLNYQPVSGEELAALATLMEDARLAKDTDSFGL